MQKEQIKQLVDRITSTQIKEPNQRVKVIVDRMLLDLFNVIDDFDVQPEEFWSALSYMTELGQRNEYSLLSAGLGIDHYFDVRLDEKESQVGIEPGSTPRTIEGPLYVAGA
ncbi:MAG: catA, partial [Microvirga sp.]|nr:catA [Microvirga sp.]